MEYHVTRYGRYHNYDILLDSTLGKCLVLENYLMCREQSSLTLYTLILVDALNAQAKLFLLALVSW